VVLPSTAEGRALTAGEVLVEHRQRALALAEALARQLRLRVGRRLVRLVGALLAVEVHESRS